MRLEIGQHQFDVDVQGPREAPAVLLLHGFPQTAHCWRHVTPWLKDFRVIVPDQRGYSPGARPLDVDPYRIPVLVADALGILDALDIEQAHVVGHDWGAAVAWQLGAVHASRVLTLTTVCVPHPRAFIEALRTDEEQRERSLYMREFAKPGYDQVLLANDAALLRSIFSGADGTVPHDVDVEDVVRRAAEPGALAAWLRWYAAQRLEDIGSTPAVDVPTLHVWADADQALGRAGAEGTAAWCTGEYRFEVLEGVSHWVPEQAADRLAALLLAHLA